MNKVQGYFFIIFISFYYDFVWIFGGQELLMYGAPLDDVLR